MLRFLERARRWKIMHIVTSSQSRIFMIVSADISPQSQREDLLLRKHVSREYVLQATL